MDILKVLAVDDHKMTVMGYKYILEGAAFDGFEIQVDIAASFDLGKQKIERSKNGTRYDIILLDIQLFPLEANDPRSGEDLGILAKSIVPESKVIFMSSFSDGLRIQSIFKSVTPDGYMVKSEIDEYALTDMVNTVRTGVLYYSPTALSAMRKIISQQFDVDIHDKMILHEISKGTKTKDIASIVPLSQASIENRKRQLKLNFGIKDGNDLALINEARNKGFL